MTPSAVTHGPWVFSIRTWCREANRKAISQGVFALTAFSNGARSIWVLRRLIVVIAGTVGRFASLRLGQKNRASALDALVRIYLIQVRAGPSGGGLSRPNEGWFNDERALWLARINGDSQSVIPV